jgi:uncharacterized protein YjbI with pentapeptide repeats
MKSLDLGSKDMLLFFDFCVFSHFVNLNNSQWLRNSLIVMRRWRLWGWRLRGWKLHRWRLRGRRLCGGRLCGGRLHGWRLSDGSLHGRRLRGWRLHGWRLRGWRLRGKKKLQQTFLLSAGFLTEYGFEIVEFGG